MDGGDIRYQLIFFRMDWFLRQWNERSFPGWKAWWQQVIFIGFGGVLLQSWLGMGETVGVVSIAVVLRTILILGAGWIALALLTASTRVYSWRAALAGWSRLLPGALLVPFVDAVVRWFAPSFVHGHWWFGPSQISGWFIAGWVNGGFVSFGLTLLVLFLALAMAVRLGKAGLHRGTAAFFGVLVVGLAWFVLALPSFVAWTQLSTYGTTFAPVERVVEQAFVRVWSKSLWYDQAERFLDVRMIDTQLGERFALAMMAWMLVFGLAAPLLSRARFASWKTRAEEMGLVVAPVLGGVILGLTRVAGQTTFASVTLGIFILSLLVLLSRYLRRLSADDDPDERWMTLALLLSGAFLLGWMPLLLVLAALALFHVASEGDGWWLQAGYRGSAWAVLFLFGWAVMARVTGSAWSPVLVLGVFGVFKGLSLMVAYQAVSGGDKAVVIGSTRISGRVLEQLLLISWVLSIGLLWWGVGQLAFGGAALVLAILAPAALWLLPLEGKRATVALFLLPILLGLLLHSGIFLP